MDKLVGFLFGVFGVIVVVLVLVFGIMLIYKMLFKSKTTSTEENGENVPEENKDEKVVYPYKLNNPIFSPKEGYFYRDARPIADKLGLLVFTKMRLADLLYIPKGTADYQKWFNRIKAKHIDFIFVDKEMHIKLLVEVDDPTHNKPDRQARDEEVDEIFRQQGIEVLHLRAWGKQYGAEDLETIITNALNVQKTAPGSEQQK